MKFIQDIENQGNLRALVLYDLKELGLKPPKQKKTKGKEDTPPSVGADAVFGNYLSFVPCCYIEECGPVPKFLVDATRVIEKHIDIEGVFRKSGSVARQKELKLRVESGLDLGDANPLDVASLIKQFFRELPDPLLTSRLHDTFLKAHTLEGHDARLSAILLLCYLLPFAHQSVLRFIMRFLLKVSMNSDLNKMDISNISVCMTPNLLLINNKNDKMNASESKLLQTQTSIVEMLIDHAEDIGMVSESLFERTTLMSACWPSEDELEKSDTTTSTQDDSKTTKKKKRRGSGSFQGLFSSLSSSFNKKRKPDYNKSHNVSGISDKSTMSCFEKSSMTSMMSVDQYDYSLPAHSVTLEYMENVAMETGMVDATPKMMRKRKAEEEVVPFSANKKKAILQGMPQNTLFPGTPFTPSTCRRPGTRGQDFMDTPSIKFAENHEMVFSATATPVQTPRRKMEKLFSPATQTKVKRRHSSGKSSCFSPKTPKAGVRRTVKGFFRRLSGGKDPLPSPAVRMNQSDVGERMTSDENLARVQGEKKRSSFFRRHKKTPSSPARLVTQLQADLEKQRTAMGNQSVNCSLTSMMSQGLDDSLSNTELAAQLQADLRLNTPGVGRTPSTRSGKHRRTLSGGANLKRGKPNTVKVGLPENKRRSVDTTLPTPQPEPPVSQGAPHTPAMVRCSSTVDTSPISKEDASPLASQASAGLRRGEGECNPVDIDPFKAEDYLDGEEEELDQEEEEGDLEDQLSDPDHDMSRQTSKSSLNSIKLDDDLDLLDHDRAFINESLLAEEVSILEEEIDKVASETDIEEDFKRPIQTTDIAKVKSHSHVPRHSGAEDVTNQVDSATHGVSHDQHLGSHDTHVTKASIKLRTQRSVESVDSAVEADSVQSLDPADSRPSVERSESMSKAGSMQSINSCDSGVSCQSGPDTSQSECRHRQISQSDRSGGNINQSNVRQVSQLERRSREVNKSTRPPSGKCPKRLESFLRDGHTATVVRRQDLPRNGHEPILQISGETSHILSRAGLTSQRTEADTHQVERDTGLDTEEVAARKASPFRFPNSTMRRRHGASPVRIPTIFAKGEKDAQKYRDIVKEVTTPVTLAPTRGNSPNPHARTPSLPISTTLLRSIEGYVGTPERLGEGPKAGRTPLRALAGHALRPLNLTSDLAEGGSDNAKVPLRDSSNIDTQGQSEIRVKPALISSGLTTQRLAKVMSGAKVIGSKAVGHRGSPVKPVKRLQSPAKSPRYSRSPKRYTTSPRKQSDQSGVPSKAPTFSPLPVANKELY